MNLLHSIEQEDAVERKKPEPKDIDARTSTGPIMDDYAEGD
jgi:hypothetical protein